MNNTRKICHICNYGMSYDKAIEDKEIILNNFEFPYLNKYYTDKQIIHHILTLINFKVDIINKPYILKYIKLDNYKFKNEYIMIVDNSNEYPVIEEISDYFNEHCRMKCKFTGAEYSPYDYFQNNFNKVILNLKEKNLPINPKNMREVIYDIGPKQCSSFKPKLIKYFIEKFNAKRVLDISSGWGDRLIGALACDVDVYHGHDPNTCLFDGYKKIINFYKEHFNRNGNYVIKNIPFEETELEDNYYDLMMTSPPYFNVEVYSDETTQSISSINNEIEWVDSYLMKWIEITRKALRKGGIMAMNINQFGNYKYVDYMIENLKKHSGWEYLGVISHSKVKNNYIVKPQPTFIYKKL